MCIYLIRCWYIKLNFIKIKNLGLMFNGLIVDQGIYIFVYRLYGQVGVMFQKILNYQNFYIRMELFLLVGLYLRYRNLEF